MLLRGELPTDDLTVNSQALPGGGFSSSWVDDIEAQSEAGISATLGLGGLNLNQENESELLLEELMAAGGDHAWWDVLFNDVRF